MEPDNSNQPQTTNSEQFSQSPAGQPVAQPVSGSWSSPTPATGQPISTTPEMANQAQPTAPVYGQPGPVVPLPTAKKNKRKLFLIGGIVATVVLIGGASAGAYFGFVVPNKPDNIWKNGLSNTATAYDKLVSSNEKRDIKKGGNFKATYKYDSKDFVLDGTVDTKFNGMNSNTTVDVGAAGTRISANVLTVTAANSKNPDIYAKVSGLAGIDKLFSSNEADITGIGAALAAYDNQWYVIDHTLLDQAEKGVTKDQTLPTNLTKEDTKAITDAIGRVNRDYIFTTDPSKAVLTKSQNVGKEQYDNRDAYHFKVGYKKDKLKAYVAAMNTELKKTKLSSYLTDTDLKDINASIDRLDDSKQADAWVDMNTKLIRNVRIVTDASKGEHIDIGQKYNGGDEIPFSLGFTSAEKDNDGTATLLVTTNTKSNDVKIKADLNAKTNGTPMTFTLSGTLTGSDAEVKIDKPANAKSLLELYSQLFGGFTGASTGSSTQQSLLEDTGVSGAAR